MASGQKGEDFYKSVAQAYNKSFKPRNREVRSCESLRKRSELMHKEFMRFNFCYAQCLWAKPTGVLSLQDLVWLATGLFNNFAVASCYNDCDKPFRFLQARETIRKHEKCKPAMVAVDETKGSFDFAATGVEDSDKTSAAPSSVEQLCDNVLQPKKSEERGQSAARPIGRGQAKDMLEKRHGSLKKIKIAEEAQKRRNDYWSHAPR